MFKNLAVKAVDILTSGPMCTLALFGICVGVAIHNVGCQKAAKVLEEGREEGNMTVTYDVNENDEPEAVEVVERKFYDQMVNAESTVVLGSLITIGSLSLMGLILIADLAWYEGMFEVAKDTLNGMNIAIRGLPNGKDIIKSIKIPAKTFTENVFNQNLGFVARLAGELAGKQLFGKSFAIPAC